ncbi:MAG: hypothetical protein L3J39_19095 [Verrucomicrobiales bacterium]|nr:hypothetical protein [Verrucomicrobiales bacterium]
MNAQLKVAFVVLAFTMSLSSPKNCYFRIGEHLSSCCWLMFFCLVAVSCTGCKQKEISYPIEHSFTDPKDGSSIEVSITGRSATHIDFIRQKDVKFFSFPIIKLTKKDQTYVEKLPINPSDEKIVPAVARNNPPYIQTRLEQIVRLEKNISQLTQELKGESNNPGMQRQHQRQILEKKAEIEHLKKAIADRKSSH